MADILAFNLTQTYGTGAHVPRKMNAPDLSTRLKLMGVDVASFGDHFADLRSPVPVFPSAAAPRDGEVLVSDKPSKRAEPPVKCLTYHDPFGATYKKYIFNAAGTHLIGGIMVGDVGDFTKLVAITKKKVRPVFSPRGMSLSSRKSSTCRLPSSSSAQSLTR